MSKKLNLDPESVINEIFDNRTDIEIPETQPLQTITDDGELKETELMASKISFSPENYFDMMERLESLDDYEETVSVQPRYIEMKTEGAKIRGMFLGFGTITKREADGLKDLEVVKIMTKEGVLMNAGADFIGQFRAIEVGTLVSVEYSGEKKTASGNKMKEFIVRMLVKK